MCVFPNEHKLQAGSLVKPHNGTVLETTISLFFSILLNFAVVAEMSVCPFQDWREIILFGDTFSYSCFFCGFSKLQGYSLNSTEMLKMLAVSKIGCRVVFLKYQSMQWNISVQSADQSKFYFNLFCRLVADSYFKKLCNTVRYTQENIKYLTWRIIATNSCIPSCARINK